MQDALKESLQNANFALKSSVSSLSVQVVRFAPVLDFRTNFIIFQEIPDS